VKFRRDRHGGPSHRCTVENDPESIAHGRNISGKRVERSARSLSWGLPGPSLFGLLAPPLANFYAAIAVVGNFYSACFMHLLQQ